MLGKKKNNNYDTYEEDIIDLATKEEEIMESYEEMAEDDIEEYEVEEERPEEISEKEEKEEEYQFVDEDNSIEYTNRKVRIIRRIVNIVFIVIMFILAMIAIDVICVARYDVGPFFAIPLKKYDDGGTKAYYGIGYKVIKYNQIQGRRDRELGFWSLKYNTDPITLQDIDLAIEMNNNEIETYQKYYKKFVRIISTLEKVNKEKHQITIGYKDEDGKYSLDIICDIVDDQTNLDSLEEGKEITIIGTIKDFKGKTAKKSNRLYIKNCFAEQ